MLGSLDVKVVSEWQFNNLSSEMYYVLIKQMKNGGA